MQRALAVVALISITLSPRAEGQVSGTVRDAATSDAVRGAAVLLLGPNRELLARTITSSSGSFRIAVDSAAHLRVMRIGYSPYERPLEGVTSPLNIEMSPLGTTLRPVTVHSNPVCPARADQREALSLWSTATDAFSSMDIAPTEESQSGEVRQILFDRVVISNGRWILRQSTKRIVTTNVTPIRATRTPEEYVRHGYIAHQSDASTYFAPDPQVLLHSTFAETHCLSLQRDEKAHPGEIGVAVTPTTGRDSIAEISGVVWMTRAPMALKSLDFEYRGVDQLLLRIGAGGRLEFETLSNGVPIIRQWHVRSPRLQYFLRGRTLMGTVGGRPADLIEIHESGSLIADGQLAGGTVVTASLARFSGRVTNGGSGASVGASIVFDSTDHSAVTGEDGGFTIDGVFPGPYTLRARDSVLISSVRVDSTGTITPDSATQLVVTREVTTDVDVHVDIPNIATLTFPRRARMPSCQAGDMSDRLFIVLGVLENAAGERMTNARVRLTWADTSKQWGSAPRAYRPTTMPIVSTESHGVETVTDAQGDFVTCEIPGGRSLLARVVTSEGTTMIGSGRINPRPDDVSQRFRNPRVRGLQLIVKPE